MKNSIQQKLATLLITAFSIVLCSGLVVDTGFANYNNDQLNLSTTTFDLKTHLKVSTDDKKAKKAQDYLDKNPLKTFVFDRIIEPAIKLMGTIAVILVIVGGFKLMTAQGESDQIDKGKDIIKYAMIGLVVALFSYVIVITTQSIFT